MPSALRHTQHTSTCTAPQDPLYRPNYALSLAGTRELTSARVKKFVDQRFFSVSDYLHGER